MSPELSYERGTTSPSDDLNALMFKLPSSNASALIPSKHFFHVNVDLKGVLGFGHNFEQLVIGQEKRTTHVDLSPYPISLGAMFCRRL